MSLLVSGWLGLFGVKIIVLWILLCLIQAEASLSMLAVSQSELDVQVLTA